jgi:ERCC4-related helicase
MMSKKKKKKNSLSISFQKKLKKSVSNLKQKKSIKIKKKSKTIVKNANQNSDYFDFIEFHKESNNVIKKSNYVEYQLKINDLPDLKSITKSKLNHLILTHR